MTRAFVFVPLLGLVFSPAPTMAQEPTPTRLAESIPRESARLSTEAATPAEPVAVVDAQTPPQANDEIQLRPGARLRVTVEPGSPPLVGTLLAFDDKMLTLDTAGRKTPTVLRRGSIVKVEVSAGRGSRGTGALIGAAVFAAAGAVMGLASGGGFILSAEAQAGVGALMLAPVGALVGLAVPPANRWKEVPADGIRLSLTPLGRRGAAVSLTFAF